MRVKKFLLPFAFFVKGSLVFAQSSQEIIKINQSGYYPAAPKIAIVASDYSNDEYAGSNFGFYVLKFNSTDTVYKNSLGPVRQSSNSSIKTRLADFSALQQPGKYLLFIPGIGTSYPFEIKTNIHEPAAKAVLKGFYFNRVSMPLQEKYAGKWHRPAGHPDTAVLIHPSAATDKRPAGTLISSPGGWYDGSYASNEIAINWNAPAVYLFNAIEALQKKVRY